MTKDESVQAQVATLAAGQVSALGQCFDDGVAFQVANTPVPTVGGQFTQADIDAAVAAAKAQAQIDQDAAVAVAVAAEKAKIVGEAQPLIDELKS